MNFEGQSVIDLIGSKEDPQTAINTADIAALTPLVARNTKILARCATNPSSLSEVSQIQLAFESGARTLLQQGLGVNGTTGLLSSRYTTHPSITFGLGQSGTPMDIRYRVSSASPVKFKVNLQLNVIFPAQLVIYQVKLYLFVTFYNAGSLQVGYYYLDTRVLVVPPGGITTSVSINDYIITTGTLSGIDEIRISPKMDSSYGPGPLPTSIEIVQNWTRPIGNHFEVEVL